MTEPDAPSARPVKTDEIVIGAPRSPEPAISPARSALAVLGGTIVYWLTLSLFMGMTAALFPSFFPAIDTTPTTAGLAAILVGELVNGVIAGLLTGRLAGRAPLVHAAALAGILGLYAMTSMGQVRGMPGWFALGYGSCGSIAVMIGGAIALRVQRRRPEA